MKITFSKIRAFELIAGYYVVVYVEGKRVGHLEKEPYPHHDASKFEKGSKDYKNTVWKWDDTLMDACGAWYPERDPSGKDPEVWKGERIELGERNLDLAKQETRKWLLANYCKPISEWTQP